MVDNDLEQFSSIASASNLAIADSSLLTLEPGIMAGRLANRQIAVEEEVLVELEKSRLALQALLVWLQRSHPMNLLSCGLCRLLISLLPQAHRSMYL